MMCLVFRCFTILEVVRASCMHLHVGSNVLLILIQLTTRHDTRSRMCVFYPGLLWSVEVPYYPILNRNFSLSLLLVPLLLVPLLLVLLWDYRLNEADTSYQNELERRMRLIISQLWKEYKASRLVSHQAVAESSMQARHELVLSAQFRRSVNPH